MYLPGNRGFDYYLGIPYSDDMGSGRVTPCKNETVIDAYGSFAATDRQLIRKKEAGWQDYVDAGFVLEDDEEDIEKGGDPAGNFLPLVYQEHNSGKLNTTILEQVESHAAAFLSTSLLNTQY
jgi:hypothetical protein